MFEFEWEWFWERSCLLPAFNHWILILSHLLNFPNQGPAMATGGIVGHHRTSNEEANLFSPFFLMQPTPWGLNSGPSPCLRAEVARMLACLLSRDRVLSACIFETPFKHPLQRRKVASSRDSQPAASFRFFFGRWVLWQTFFFHVAGIGPEQ